VAAGLDSATSASHDSADAELWGAVRELPPKQRAAVVLRFVNDLPHRDIATVLDCSEAAARRSLHEGLAKLREEWT
jgi:RNA polymerase sigma factor (sigma-70 family)